MAQDRQDRSDNLAMIDSRGLASSSSNNLTIIDSRERRGSVSSFQSQIDKEQLTQHLDTIHSTASKSGTLTSFSDFDGRGKSGRSAGPKELVGGRLSGLYTRLRQSVGGASLSPTESTFRPASRSSLGYTDTASVTSSSSTPYKTTAEDKSKQPSLQQQRHPEEQQPDLLKSAPPGSPPSLVTPRNHSPFGHVASSSLSLAADDSASLHSNLSVSLLRDEPDALPFPVAQRLPAQSHSRPGSRDIHINLALAKLQGSPSASSPRVERKDTDMSNRSSFHAPPFRPEEGLGIEEHSSRNSIVALSPGPEVDLHHPFKPLPSHPGVLSGTPSRRQSQAQSQHETPVISLRSAISSPAVPPSLTFHQIPDRPTLRVTPSHLPNLRISEPSSPALSALTTRVSTPLDGPAGFPSPNFNAGFQDRRQHSKLPQTAKEKSSVIPVHWRRRVLSKEFWMKDENARDCFHCGAAFSTFRRKHHCRTCGQIFDSQCTTIVPGKDFGHPGNLRLCRPCEAMIYGSDDDSTVFSDDEQPKSAHSLEEGVRFDTNNGNGAAPTIGIPVSKRNRDVKRRSAVIEFDQPMLARPSSSRSLKSATGRPKSSNHKRRSSRQVQVNSRPLRYLAEERGPFSQDAQASYSKSTPLVALNQDDFIDPDIADYMSDEYSEDDQQSMFATLNDGASNSPLDGADKAGLSGFLASAVKKGRSRRGDRSAAGQSIGRASEAMFLGSRNPVRQNRRRNGSVNSFAIDRPSPRRARSTNILRALDLGGHKDSGPGSSFEKLPSGKVESQIKCSYNMQGQNAPAIELNSASLQHVRRLLAQLLKDFKIPNRKKWEKALMPILLQCTDDVDPDVQHGDDMDIRNYIKLKKIPGGNPGDTAYVSGVVFSKNVALKDMARKYVNPRIVIITFPIEYTRHHSSLFSLETLVAQEREYIANLVGRIVALKPQILLVERQVCGLALQMMQEAGVTVVYNIKDSVLAAVARVTQTVLIKSQDKLSIDPENLGRCGTFEVKTYVHGNRKKTYVWMSGCQPDLGCTIILRGAGMETLRAIKRVTEFMSYVVYNLRLETSLMRDEFALIPSAATVEAEQKEQQEQKLKLETMFQPARSPKVPLQHRLKLETMFQPPKLGMESVTPTPRAEIENPMDVVNASDPMRTIRMSSDAISLKHLGDVSTLYPGDTDTTTNVIAQPDVEDEAMPSQYRALIDTARSRLMSSSPFVKFTEPYLLGQAQEQERKVEQSKRLRDRYDSFVQSTRDEKSGGGQQTSKAASFQLVMPEMLDRASPEDQPENVRKFVRDMHDAQYDMALREYEIKKRQWESFFTSSGNDPFNPFNHQNIWVLHSIVSSATSVPCAGPEVFGFGFYAGYGNPNDKLEEDCTLGQFVEEMCHATNNMCKNCNRKMLDHHRQYVHGHGQLSISVKRYPSKYPSLKDTIFMFAACKVCHQETTWMPMSDNSWKYSFGKYLELSFWSTPLKPRAGVCPHDIHKDFARYFVFNGLAVRVQYDPVELYDVSVPRPTITWQVEEGLLLKNELFTHFETKLNAFMRSVKARLESINLSSVPPEKSADATAMVEKLVQRAETDHDELLAKLRAKYMASQFYEVIPMNRALRMMDEKAIAWDDAFADFERNYFPSENDIRRLATLQLKKLFLDRNEVADHQSQDASDAEDGMEMQDRPPVPAMKLTDEELQSEKAQDMLTSVVQEHGHSVDDSDLATPLGRSDEPDLPDLTAREREQAAEQENVKHLDLAVPSSLPSESPMDIRSPQSLKEGELDAVVPSSESPATEPEPLNSTLLERIELMRSTTAGSGTSDQLPESRIPRLAGLGRRGAQSPILARAKSQPSQIPRLSGESLLDVPSSVEAPGSDDQSGTVTPTPNGTINKDLAKSIEQRLVDRLGTGRRAQASLIPRSVPTKQQPENTTRVSTLAKHFEQLSREFERERLRERRQRAARNRQVRANPLASSRPVVEIYTDPRLAVGEGKDDRLPLSGPDPAHDSTQTSSDATDPNGIPNKQDEGDTTDHYTTDTDLADSTTGDQTDTDADGDEGSFSPSRSRDDVDPFASLTSSTALSSHSAQDDQHLVDLPLPKHEKSSLMRMLTSFWSERSASGWLPLEYPLHPSEHVFDDSDIVVREDEPSSVIALALSSADYVTKVDAFRLNPTPRSGPSHSHQPSHSSFVSSSAQMHSTTMANAQAAIEASLISPTGTHMKYSFAHGPVKTTCKIFYAESFDALRRKCGVSDRFVESLSRCAKWDSKGGKTKSLFLKTLDDRFVIKSLQEVELKAFTKFAPDYFGFMSHTLFHGVPSVIAKMFGLFQVTIRNPITGTEFSSYLLVMENLFYSKNPTRRFDLKGSMRNRKIQSTGQPDEVLLDENLVETIFETPLFVREHARKLLRAGVWNDTMWLCKQNVMDYSLMAGFDDEKKELVVGIIDCIRTYTWDKKLESWIKDRGKNKPTITSPKDYRNRFRVSMMQYVLQSPNVWHGFLSQVSNSVVAMQGTMGRPYDGNASLDDRESMARMTPYGSSSRPREMGDVQGALGRGFDGTEPMGTAGVVKGRKEKEKGEVAGERGLVGSVVGHLMGSEATIREMSSMTFG